MFNARTGVAETQREVRSRELSLGSARGRYCEAGNEGKNSNYSGTHLGFFCGERQRRLNLHRQLIHCREIWKSRAAAACKLSARGLVLYESHRIRALNALATLSQLSSSSLPLAFLLLTHCSFLLRFSFFLLPLSLFPLPLSFLFSRWSLFLLRFIIRNISRRSRRKINKTDARYRHSNRMALNERIGHLAGIFVTASRRLVCHITSHRLFPSGGAPQTRVLPYAAKLCSPMHNSDDAFATVALLLIRSSGSTEPAIALDVHADHRIAYVLVIVTRQIRILLFISFVYTLRERFQLVETCCTIFFVLPV